MPRIVIIAGEASGDQLGAGLIAAAKAIDPDIVFEGVGGPEMEAAGFSAWFSYERLAVFGLFEVLKHLPDLLNAGKDVKQRILKNPPDLVIGIDAPDFNLRVEKTVKAAGIPVMHYVCPSIWAWRESRVKHISAAADHVLCLLPFEPDFLQQHKISGEFVGHPLADEIIEPLSLASGRSVLGLDAQRRVAILPGSRMSEVQRLGPVFAETAAWLVERIPDIRFVAPFANQKTREAFKSLWQSAGVNAPLDCVDGHAREAMAAADVVLLASGTATLEAMLVGRPMVVAYRLSPVSYWLARLFKLIKLKYFSLPNLLAGEAIVPEMIQHDAVVDKLGPAVLAYYQSADGNKALLQRFEELQGVLRQNASQKSAKAAIRMVAEGLARKG
ncbi:MAG: lipid-A-disaccharide synthase [Gammaproteobacteria bacterium]|nr:lipid-A-disaccharide synthase [Gammaproteobacteria bacterium]